MKILILVGSLILLVAGFVLYLQHISSVFGIIFLVIGALLLGNTLRRFQGK